MGDRSWMYRRHVPGIKGITEEFELGVKDFIAFAVAHAISDKIRCPCSKCTNKKFREPDDVEIHLYRFGFVGGYSRWTCHGEPYHTESGQPSSVPGDRSSDRGSINPFREMVMDAAGPGFGSGGGFPAFVEEPPNAEAQKFYDMLQAADTPIWDGCSTHSQLSLVSRLLHIKSENTMSEKCFNQVVHLMKEVAPDRNKIPDDFYGMKKLVSGLGLPVQKIDSCSNGCMLYWKDDDARGDCKFCGHPRYMQKRVRKGNKLKEIPLKRMYYFPITPRLQRLYASKTTAEHMSWHADSIAEAGYMSHPRDGEAWQNFNNSHPEFTRDARNVRLGLCTDGFSPFGMSGKQYSCWPVILTPYNLPPWMCMKDPVMFFTVIIPGPKNPKHKIDVYLQPLIDELIKLWSDGVPTYDISKKQNFQLRAALLWTINDFPAYGMLSGWSTAGRFACPYCMENTKSFQLRFGGKTSWFDCHRRFLPSNHPFRRDTRSFRSDRGLETSLPVPRSSGDQVWAMVSQFSKITDDGRELGRSDGRGVNHNWTKKSIFWDLPYWRSLLVPHNIDIMHNEKNVFDNVFNTIMDVKGKTKDNLKARRDMEVYCDRPELHVFGAGEGRLSVPKACYSLTLEAKKVLLEWIRELRLPDGYASNLARCVDIRELKMSGMKSHDCHVFMERLLPTALRELLPQNVWSALAELSLFYRDLCSPKLSISHLSTLESDIAVLICKLEKIFPPGFFDVMEHLILHLPYEARVCGPAQYRWMYPFERFLHRLKVKVKNKARVEGSICNAYLVEEASTFFSHYFDSHVPTRHTRVARNEEIATDQTSNEHSLSICLSRGRPLGKVQTRFLTSEELKVANNYILLNCEEVQPYINTFSNDLRSQNTRITEVEVSRMIENEFAKWFKDYVRDPTNRVANRSLQCLSWGPSRQVKSFQGYIINGYRFHTKEHAEGRKSVNHGVCVKGSENENNSVDYYGVLKEVIEVHFPGHPLLSVALFKCDWFDSTPNRGTRVHPQYKLVDVNSKRSYPKFDPFVLAQQAQQVYFASYPGIKRPKSDWLAVYKIKARHVIDAPIVDRAYQEEVSDSAAVSISLVVDLGILTHEQGLNELLEVREEESDRDRVSNSSGDHEGDDWETDFETDEDSDENVSGDDSSE